MLHLCFLVRTRTMDVLELEIQLREHCRKIRIHTQLSGAHMIFPQEQGLAIRSYCHPPTQYIEDPSSTDTDPDGILDFCFAFQWSMVLFVVPDILSTEPNDMHGFVQQSMQLLDHPIPSAHQQKHPPRFLVVSNAEQALVAIMECADSIAPSRCALRHQYLEKIRHDHYVPKNTEIENHANSSNDKENVPAKLPKDPIINEEAVAVHYAKTVREWCDRTNVPDGDANVILHALPTLHQLIHAATDTNGTGLNHVPIEEKTKRQLRYFFSARDGDDDTNYCNNNNNGGRGIDQMDVTASYVRVASPPSFHRDENTRAFGDHDTVMNSGAVVPNQHNYSSQHQPNQPYLMAQDGMDFDVIPAAAAAAPPPPPPPFYHVHPSAYIRLPPQNQYDGNSHRTYHDPSTVQSYNNGGMHQVANLDPLAHQYHLSMSEPYDFPNSDRQHQHYVSPLPYNEHRPMSLQQQPRLYQHNTLQNAETIAKVIPWGQPPPPMTNYNHSMMYALHPRQQHNIMNFPQASSIPNHFHQPPMSSRASLSSPPLASSQGQHYHPQRQSLNAAVTTKVTPYDGSHLQRHHNNNPRDETNSLRKVVRRFM